MTDSPLLPTCPPGLPRAAYLDEGWFLREQAGIWGREWVCVGRLSDLPPGTLRPVIVAGAPVLLARGAEGAVHAFHNTCRHRGAELCAAERPLGRLITCPYHAWAYAAADGRLVATGPATPTPDFDRDAHGLIPVATTTWAGFLFVSLSPAPPPLSPDPDVLHNWPMDALVTGHRHERILHCNWKVFWENYNECLHCPGIHPKLIDMVPVYARGVMSPSETTGYDGPTLKPGAVTWTPDGKPCGPLFPGLTEGERQAGFTFVTLYPTLYVVAHVDYVRAVRLDPLSPTTTRLTAEWLFPPETLRQPGFDPAHVACFAQTVLDQDAEAAEMNQRGLASPAFTRATLMPQEFDLHRFHAWVMDRLERETP